MEKLTKKERKVLKKQQEAEKQANRNKEKTIKRIVFSIASLVVVGLAVWAFLTIPKSSSSPIEAKVTAPPITQNDIATGSAKAKVQIVEYADFQCPACTFYSPIVNQIRQDYKNEVLFAYRFLPLSQHEYAFISSQAAYAAHLQGKFWEMYNLLYKNSEEWTTSSAPQEVFKKYAEEIGLDIEKYEVDFKAEKTKKFIQAQSEEALKIGVMATPSFFINGELVQVSTYEDFKGLIDSELLK